MKKTTRDMKIHTNPLGDNWIKTKASLAEASAEQTSADIALAEATAALVAAQSAQRAAIARKTSAETRLAQLRSKLAVALPAQEG